MGLPDFTIRLVVALALSMTIGFERQYKHRMAGIRTNVLVCIGSFLFVSAGILDTVGDRSRVVAQVVSGIGFLAGGVIIREGFNIKGLNTAATLWGTSAIGVITSLGFINYAILGTVFILASNILIGPLTKKVFNNMIQQEDSIDYEVNITCPKESSEEIRSMIITIVNEMDMAIRGIESRDSGYENKVNINAIIITGGKRDKEMEKIVNAISTEAGVINAGWKTLG